MINFRFHLVSLVAVFLALAIGIVMGYGVLGQPTVNTLQNRIDAVEAKADAARHENDQLKQDAEQSGSAIAAVAPFALTKRLSDSTVLVLAVRGVNEDAVASTVALARQGGAQSPGILWLESKWTLKSAADRRALAAVINTDATKRTVIRQRAWNTLADRLVNGPNIQADVLTALANRGFITYQSVGNGGNRPIGEIGGSGTPALLIVGTDAQIPVDDVVVPFTHAAVDAQLGLVIAEEFHQQTDGPERGSLVSGIRADSTLAQQVSTIDDFDRPYGPVTSLLALADLTRGVVGHYGFGDGATPTPAWWEP